MDAAARLNATARALLLGAAALLSSQAQGDGHDHDALPARLSDTGLYVAGSTKQVRPGVLAFAPHYTLWSDAADKQRWIALPPGGFIDASLPDAWQFPPGTKLWKEFSHAGRRVETRTIQRLRDGSWRYATYLWSDDGSDAVLAPARGVPAWPVAQAPGGRYAVPSRSDCTGCHESAAAPVLGFSALQLSSDLRALAASGVLRNLPAELLMHPPRIEAANATERAALGYLHGNCGHCHNDEGPLAVLEMSLAQRVARQAPPGAALRSLASVPSQFRMPGGTARIAPGRPDASIVALRMNSREPLLQMPPLGTSVVDAEAMALISRWIEGLSVH
jgi:hypothetical protein